MYQAAGTVWELCAVTRVSLCLVSEESGSHIVTVVNFSRVPYTKQLHKLTQGADQGIKIM